MTEQNICMNTNMQSHINYSLIILFLKGEKIMYERVRLPVKMKAKASSI